MKALSPAYLAHLGGELLTLANLWRVTLIGGTVLRFTGADEDIVFEGERYLAIAAFTASNVQTSAGFSVGNLEVQGFLVAPSITRDAVLSGQWEYALLELFRVNRYDLTMGKEWITKGRLGNVTIGRNSFTAEFRNMAQPLQRNIGWLTQAMCRYDLGDSGCTKDLTAYTCVGAEVVSVESQHEFTTDLGTFTVALTPSTTGAPTNDYFQGGAIRWLTGLNAGTKAECENNTGGDIALTGDMYFEIQVGDTFTIVSGCNHLHKTGPGQYLGDCGVKFGNVINYGGEDELPGETVFTIGGSR